MAHATPENLALHSTNVAATATAPRNNGKKFERAFANLMRARLGVRRTSMRAQVKGKTGVRPYECDVHGEVYSPMWDTFRYFTLATGILALVCVALRWFPEEAARLGSAGVWLANLCSSLEDRARSIHGALAPYAVAVLGIGCSMLAGLAKKRVERHVWAECKDRKTTIKRTDIIMLAGKVDDVRKEDSDAEWRPDEVWFASTSAFDQDALAFARQHRIRCLHVRADGSITELA